MIRNYILIHFRALYKKPLLSLINVIGLAIGISACLLCYLHIEHELSYDQFNTKANRIYRLVTGDMESGEGWVKVSAPIPPKLAADIPEIESFTRLGRVTYNPKITVRYEENVFNEDYFYMADPAILDIFDIPLIIGDKKQVLADPNSVIISETVSERLFGEEDPLGKLIEVGSEHNFQVSGVFSNIPGNSHISFDYLISFENLVKMLPGTSLTSNWGQFNYFAYVLLIDSDVEEVAEDKIATTIVQLDGENQMKLEDINLQPLSDIHFQDNRGNVKQSYDSKYLYIYSAVAIAILVISIINFINLTIAGSTKRIKEVGVRKAVGARRDQLVLQYISESFLVALIALIMAIFLANFILLPTTNQVLQSHIVLDFSSPILITYTLMTLFLISLSSGFYIAVFVTSFKPTQALKGTLKIGSKGSLFKNLLLGTQFLISLVLILSSIFIYQQLNLLKDQDLGINPDQVINIALYNQEAKQKANLLKSEIKRLPWVLNATNTRFIAGQSTWNQTVWWEGQEESENMAVILADQDFLSTLDLELIEGEQQVIESELSEGEMRYILNESAREHIGWQTALGKSFQVFGKKSVAPVAGVVGDYNYRSLHNNIAPVVIAIYGAMAPGQLMVKTSSTDYQSTLKELEGIFTSVVPNTPFEYHFLDDEFQRLYEAENRTGKIIGFLTFIAIILALLGLYGLVSFAVQERTKEMAIRKVLGVTLPNVLQLLTKGYIKLLIIANIIAVPLVWYIIDMWLNNFSYRIDLEALMFIVGSALVWLFVIITVSINVYQVSKIDPVDGLRYE